MFKLFIDDIREAPDSTWIVCRDVSTAILVTLKLWKEIDKISLDHDMGQDSEGSLNPTGYDYLCRLETELRVVGESYPPPVFTIHSANPVGRQRMKQAIDAIDSYFNDLANRD